MKYCDNCGALLEDNAEFCEECGVKQEKSDVDIQKKKEQRKSGYLLIAIVLIMLLCMGICGWIYLQKTEPKDEKDKEITETQEVTSLDEKVKWVDDSKDIGTLKNRSLFAYPSRAIGEVIVGDYSVNEWKSGELEGKKYLRCSYTYDGKKYRMVFREKSDESMEIAEYYIQGKIQGADEIQKACDVMFKVEEEVPIQFIGRVDEPYENDSPEYDAYMEIDISNPEKVSIDLNISDIPYGTFYGKIISENLIQFTLDGGEKVNLQWKDEAHFLATPVKGFTDESIQMVNLMCTCLNNHSYTLTSQRKERIPEIYAMYMPANGAYCNSMDGGFPHTCEIRVKQINNSTFSFSIWEVIDENGNETNNMIFKEHTAVFESDNSTTAIYYGKQYTLYFDCSIYGEIMLDGFDTATQMGNTFYNIDAY